MFDDRAKLRALNKITYIGPSWLNAFSEYGNLIGQFDGILYASYCASFQNWMFPLSK